MKKNKEKIMFLSQTKPQRLDVIFVPAFYLFFLLFYMVGL